MMFLSEKKNEKRPETHYYVSGLASTAELQSWEPKLKSKSSRARHDCQLRRWYLRMGDPRSRQPLFGWSRAAARIPPRQKVQERILALRLAYSSAEMAPESSNVLAWLSSCAGVLPATERM